MRTLTRRELNRALLARQLLLERGDVSLPEALERICGIQAQYAPSMYFGLWSRLRDFEPAALTRALEARDVVQGTLMRVTIHLVSPGDYRPFAVAVREARRALWLRAWKEPDAAAMAEAASTLRAALADRGALPRKEVEALIGKPATRGIHLWLDLVRVAPSGTWERRRADLFGAAGDWLPGGAEPDPDSAMDHLVRRYLAAFGPASRKDVQSFTGLSLTTLKPVLERVATDRYLDEDGGELLDVPDAPLPDPDAPAPPRLLPTWDATLLVHARRTGLLPERFRPLIFHTKNPQSSPTFLVDGEVAGTWRLDKDGFGAEPFERVPAKAMREVRAEGERLAAAFG
ncbi:MAG TPA: winged helix DNA-binding domain-containing protein [Solirubrobacteraceae bacterium]|nr:winged helix DNA-binding domain-containing protein [Solirubrobacteraceae bacterium]